MRTSAMHDLSNPKPSWRQRGQGVAEFALVLPVLLLLVFMIIEVGRLLHAWLAIENGARFAVRYAITGEFEDVFFDDTVCSDYYAQFGQVCDTEEKKENAARVLSIVDTARAGATAILRDESRGWDEPSFFDVTLCPNRAPFVYSPPNPDNWVSDWSSDCGPYYDAGQPGNRVVITVDFNHPLIVPFLSSAWPWLHLTASREGRVEEFRVSRLVGLDPTLVQSSPTPLPTNTPSSTFTPLPTSTSTITLTPSSSPTVTPTPDCSLLTVVNTWVNGYYFEMSVRNDNPNDVFLTRSDVNWYDFYPSQQLYALYFRGSLYSTPDDASPPTTTNVSPGRIFPAGSTATWYAYFSNTPWDPGVVGSNSVTLTFDGVCVASGSVNVMTPTPSMTPTASNTPTPSRTPTPTPTPSNTSPPTITPTPSRTSTPSNTPTPSQTPTASSTPTRTPTHTNTVPPSPTSTTGPPTVTPTPSATNTPPVFEF